MTGEALYVAWCVAMGNEGVSTDAWADVPDEEKNAWDEVASNVVLANPIEKDEVPE